jgi:ATP-binding cassette subfamily F protein 3
VALLGANGNGKTTLARLLAGRLAPLSGQVTRSPKLVSSLFAQHQLDELRPQDSAFDHLSALMRKATPETVRARLGGFGFGQEKAFVPVADLSGGERARLNLALISCDAPALLILDEPTNHLDLEAREALVQAINEFNGAVVLVSHDWHLVDLVADRLWLVADRTVRPFDGDLDDYRGLVLEAAPARNGIERSPSDGRTQLRRAAAERRRGLQPLRHQAREVEAEIARLTQERAAMDRELARPQPRAGTATAEALKRRAELVRRIEVAEARWLAVAEAIDRGERG